MRKYTVAILLTVVFGLWSLAMMMDYAEITATTTATMEECTTDAECEGLDGDFIDAERDKS